MRLPLLSLLLPFVVSSSSFEVDYEGGRFLLDGRPFRYISGSIHYFRVHPDQWLDRLKRIRALGINAIQTYIPWNFHEVERGQFDFSGQRDFARFIKMASDLGMYTLLRMGPYVCAEWENGGLPYWLIASYNDIKQRTNDTRFTDEVSRYFTVLSTQIRPLLRHNGGPVLMVQIENEYGSYYACDHAYNEWLRDEAKRLLGEKTVLYTTDGGSDGYLKCGAIPDVFATVDFGPTSKESIAKSFADQKKHLPGGKGPLVNSEFYPGWLVLWGQTTQSLPSSKAIVEASKDMYEMGASFNYYLIHGGTNFGFWNGAEVDAPVITSYDYSAPIAENGDLTEKYYAIRNWIKSLPDWPTPPSTPPEPVPRRSYASAALHRQQLLEGMERTSCTSSSSPLSFEALGQQFGYVLYYTHLPKTGTNLSIADIKDFGYVYVDGERQPGTFINKYNDKKVNEIRLDANRREDALLEILVENQGRQTYETINDFKGILSPVLLEGQPLTKWTQCTVGGPFEMAAGRKRKEKKDQWKGSRSHGKGAGSPGVYSGVFHVDEVADTWVALRGWGKGHVVVNGHNIGRFWSTEGPQYSLYVPYPLLQKGRNYVTVVELEGATEGVCGGDTCTLSFDDKPDIHFFNTSLVDFHLDGRFDPRRRRGTKGH